MITVILALCAGTGVWWAAYAAADMGIGWSIFFGVLGFMAVQGVAGWLIRKRIMREMERVQAILAAGQKQLQAKMQRWQFRPPGSQQMMQRELLNDTKVFVREAIAAADGLSKYRLWVPMIERQQATAKVQLHWMIREFDKVDELMPKALLLEPTMAAIKMAHLYRKDASTEEIAKTYRKAARRLKYNQNVLLAATWSWILVQRKDTDGAFRALTEALKSSDNETLKRNHEALMNNRVAQFTNSPIGDSWYSLFLEEPKYRAPRQHNVYR